MPDSKTIELRGLENPSSNNRMELMEPIHALEYLTESSQVPLYSDSQYVIKNMTESIEGGKDTMHQQPEGAR